MGFWMSTEWSVGCFINESPYNIKNSVLYITSLLSLHRAADCATTRDGFVATQQCAQINRVCFMHAQAPVVLTTTAETADNERGVSLFCCLPTHCLAAILGLLDAESLALLGCCCQSSREFCDGQVLWRRLLLKNYGPGTVQELTVDAGEAICPDSSSAAACRMQCIRMLQHCATGAVMVSAGFDHWIFTAHLLARQSGYRLYYSYHCNGLKTWPGSGRCFGAG
jgi:hypothetical protein